jgi:holo-[acyl-carrier protein] synthase
VFEKLGIGIDIVEINRFSEKPYTKNKNFYKKIFHDSEIKYCLNNKNSAESFAAKFAIKESVIKSINNRINFLDILTDHSNLQPTVSIIDNFSYNFLVSVSHEKHNAVAVVISEKK